MNYSQTDVATIAEHLKYIKDKKYSTSILIGAVMSKSAGIPIASDIVKEIKKRSPNKVKKCTKDTYAAHMSVLSIAERKDLIAEYVDKAKVNIAHLYLGTLVKEGYVDRILTTNFDPLAIRSLALFNIFPAVYDFAASDIFIPGESADLSIYYLHGQRDGFVILNTEEEINKHAEKLKNVFRDANLNRCWIVIGYSGENDPVFNRLSEIDSFLYNLYWIGFSKEPSTHVRDKILNPQSRGGHFLGGYDADKFFLELAKELKLPEPEIISKPFSHLKESISNIAEVTIDDKIADLTQETKGWIDDAIKGFEERKGFEHLAGANKDKINKDDIVRKAREIWIGDKYDELDDILQKVTKYKIVEAYDLLAYAFNSLGIALSVQAKTEAGTEADNLFNQSYEKYAQSVKIKPDYHEAFYNWGTALLEQAKTKTGKEAKRLYDESLEKLKHAEEIKEGSGSYNLACLFALIGKSDESYQWLEKALKYDPDISRKKILEDTDFAKIKDTKEFKVLLDKYRPV